MKTAWYWHKIREEDQWDRIENPDMNPRSYTHLIFDKGDKKKIRWRIDSLFNKCWEKWLSAIDSLFNKCWEKWLSASRKLKLDPRLSPCTSINSKWIKELNIRHETLKLVLERVLEVISIAKDFLGSTPVAQQVREWMKNGTT
jgi:hypothetical protein